MIRTPVVSSNVVSVGYEPATSTLEVEFHGGRVYRYLGVPERHYRALISGAGSVGGYLNRNVKNRYPYVRVA